MKDRYKTRAQLGTTIALLILVLMACVKPTETGDNTPRTQTSVQLSWVHQIQFACFYEGVRQGYYADENLELRIDGGGFDAHGGFINPIERVLTGEVDFGVIAADQVLSARAQGKPIVAIANIFQRSPVVLISLGEKNIVHPHDLVGRRVGTMPGTNVDIAYVTLLAAKNIDRSEIDESPISDFTVNPLFNDEIDVLLGFITSGGAQAKLRSDHVNFILPSDYGIDLYASVVFTTEDTIKNRPDLVAAFVRGTIRGLQWAVDNPQEAARYVVDTYGDDMGHDLTAAQPTAMQQALPLFHPAGTRPGMMTVEAWENAHQMLLDQGILNEPLDIETAYTLTFLEQAYNEQPLTTIK